MSNPEPNPVVTPNPEPSMTGSYVFSPERYIPPRDELEWELTNLFETSLDLSPIGIEATVRQLCQPGGLPLDRFLHDIEERYNLHVEETDIRKETTLEDLAELLRNRHTADAQETSSCMVALQPEGTKLPFFCIHGAGGSVLFYKDMARHLGKDQPFYALQPLGMDRKEEPLTTVEALASRYIQDIRIVQPHGPYRVGGMCIGGLIAYEIAQQLTAAGEKVDLLALFDTRNPPAIMKSEIEKHPELIEIIKKEKAQQKAEPILRKLMRMVATVFRRIFIRKFGRWIKIKINPLLHPENRFYQHIWNANLAARDAYMPKPYKGRVVAFLAAEASPWTPRDPRWGWKHLALDGLEYYEVPGQHDTIVLEPYVGTLVKHLKPCLDSTQQSHS